MDTLPKTRLPRGIFYEAARARWRVRLYKEGEVIHRAYYHDLEEALVGWLTAKAEQKQFVRQHHTPVVDSLPNLLTTLSFSLRPHFKLSQSILDGVRG